MDNTMLRRLRNRKYRANLTPEKRQQQRTADATKKSQARSRLPDEQRQQQRTADATRHREARSQFTDEPRQQQRTANVTRQREASTCLKYTTECQITSGIHFFPFTLPCREIVFIAATAFCFVFLKTHSLPSHYPFQGIYDRKLQKLACVSEQQRFTNFRQCLHFGIPRVGPV